MQLSRFVTRIVNIRNVPIRKNNFTQQIVLVLACFVMSGMAPALGLGGDSVSSRYWRPQYVVDLSYDLHENFPWIPVPGVTFPFKLEPMVTIEQAGVAANKWHIHEHLGTQIDAPSHFAKGGRSINQLRPDELIAPIALIDFKEEAESNPDAELGIKHILEWESRFGTIPDRAIVIMNSGWGYRIDSQDSFVNMDDQGTMHFPGFSEEVTIWLVEQRNIWGLGVDTISFDPGYDKEYRAHKALESRDRWAIEAMANLDNLPPVGATLIVGAVNVRGATGGLVRPIAVWNDSQMTNDHLPQLTGIWTSRSPEPVRNAQGSKQYLVREFSFKENRWSIEFRIYADRSLSQLLLVGNNSGFYEVKNRRLKDGSFPAEFQFDERLLTPANEILADVLTAAGCGSDQWQVNETQSVGEKGCEPFRVYSIPECVKEYDIVRFNAGMLYLGSRPEDGFLCDPANRPETVSEYPLVQKL